MGVNITNRWTKIGQLQAEFESVLRGWNSCGIISYVQYEELYDVGKDAIYDAFIAGCSDGGHDEVVKLMETRLQAMGDILEAHRNIVRKRNKQINELKDELEETERRKDAWKARAEQQSKTLHQYKFMFMKGELEINGRVSIPRRARKAAKRERRIESPTSYVNFQSRSRRK